MNMLCSSFLIDQKYIQNNLFVGKKTMHTYIYIHTHKCVHLHSVQLTQSCPTLCDPMNCSMPGLPVHHQLPEFIYLFIQCFHFFFLNVYPRVELVNHIIVDFSFVEEPPYCFPQFSSVQSLSRVRLFAIPWIAAHQASLSITNSRSLSKLMSIESVMPSNHLILHCPLLLCLQSFPASGSFRMSRFFISGGQSTRV